MEENYNCPKCGSTKFNKIALVSQLAFDGDIQCVDCQNAYWGETLKELKEKAEKYCKSCTAKMHVKNFECDIANLMNGIQNKDAHTVTLNRPNFHNGGMSEDVLGHFICRDEASVFGDYCDRSIYVGVSTTFGKGK